MNLTKEIFLMTNYPATLLCDFYKISHRKLYPKETTMVYSTWTPRESRIPSIKEVVCFGVQGFIQEYLVEYFNQNFFSRSESDIVSEYSRIITFTLGESSPDTSHIVALHRLGYLPLEIRCVPEGNLAPLRVPMLIIHNTLPEFFWLTNYIETLISCYLWQPMTSATLALQYKKILNKYAMETIGNTDCVKFQGHDFSFRGMSSLDSAAISGAGHLLSFAGTDTIPAIVYLEKYYGANIENELVGCSVPASEHSIMCAYGQDEFSAYKRIITEVHPYGIVSIVSDTWDLWGVLNNTIRGLKDVIMARNGKVVIRPDSGDPVDIICGTYTPYDFPRDMTFKDCQKWVMSGLVDKVSATTAHGECGESEVSGIFEFKGKHYNLTVSIDWNRYDKQYYYMDGERIESCVEIILTPEQKGVIQILWEIFDGTINSKGYKELDPHIGCIYGDAITLERCTQINERLKAAGFASSNMVYGIGSFTYQYNTRDTFGFALKSTYCEMDNKPKFIFKDPVTDKGKVKKSQKGCVIVTKNEDGVISYTDEHSLQESEKRIDNMLEMIFRNGSVYREAPLSEIRTRMGGI